MHLSDPSREPMLERAMPADAVPGSTIPERTEAQVQLRDGSWVWCEVIGQRKDRNGRWCIGLSWYASPSIGGREGWYVLAGSRIRRFSTLTSGRPRLAAQLSVNSCREADQPQDHNGVAEDHHKDRTQDKRLDLIMRGRTCSTMRTIWTE
jgi:hypothetical protein